MGFDLVGVSDLKKVEELEALPERGLKPPLKTLPGAKSLLILGVVVWDEAIIKRERERGE